MAAPPRASSRMNPCAPAFDAEYVKDLVGGPLAEGCAAVAAANPVNPVDYLAKWLLRCVRSILVLNSVRFLLLRLQLGWVQQDMLRMLNLAPNVVRFVEKASIEAHFREEKEAAHLHSLTKQVLCNA